LDPHRRSGHQTAGRQPRRPPGDERFGHRKRQAWVEAGQLMLERLPNGLLVAGPDQRPASTFEPKPRSAQYHQARQAALPDSDQCGW
jgi:hypothetical protein